MERGTRLLYDFVQMIDEIMKYGPKSSLSPTVGDACGMCGRPLRAGEYTTLIRGSTDRRFPGTEVHYECAARRLARGTTSPVP